MSKNNGGPAFPQVDTVWSPDAEEREVRTTAEGISVRDYFAAQMVGAAYSSFWTLQSGQVPEDWRVGLAAESYKMADAMLEARDK